MGTTWPYTGSIGPVQYEDDAAVTNVTGAGFEISRQVNLVLGGQVQWTEPWECTIEGLVRQPSTSDLVSLGMGQQGTETVSTLAVEGVTLPKSIQQGDTWSQVLTFKLRASDNETVEYWLTYAFTAVAAEQVTVPAGTFHALRVDVRASWKAASDPTEAGSADLSEWYVPDVGLVKWASGAGGTGELMSSTIP
jgi:hypothetical protein